METFAVIRGEDNNKVNVALNDLVKYGNADFEDTPKQLDPIKADEILEDVMKVELRNRCNCAAIVALMNPPSQIIGMLNKMHPPAHIIIVTPYHNVFNELSMLIDNLPDMSLSWS